MIMESVAILAVTICIMVVFIRSKNTDYAISVTPLLCVPAAHLLFRPVFAGLQFWIPKMPKQLSLAFTDIAALAVTCLLIFLFSSKIKNAKNKKLYIALLSGYSIILTCAYVYQTLQPLFV